MGYREYYREFYVRGAGREISVNSDRNRPALMLTAPIILNKFSVKTVEVPLTFSPLTVDPEDMSFTTTYYTDGGSAFSFHDYLSFSEYEYFDGDLLMSKIEDKLTLHASTDVAGHVAGTTKFINGADGLPATGTLFQLLATGLTVDILDSTSVYAVLPFPNSVTYPGKPYLIFDNIPATTDGVDTEIIKVVITFPAESQISVFTDFPYWNRPLEWVVDTVITAGATVGFLSTGIELPTLRTRPSYLLLHSNIRPGLQYYSTGRPDVGTLGTVIAKVNIRMDSTQEFGSSAQVWENPIQHPDLYYPGNDLEYGVLEFWFTYPDGRTMCRFGGNNFSLTLSSIVKVPYH